MRLFPGGSNIFVSDKSKEQIVNDVTTRYKYVNGSKPMNQMLMKRIVNLFQPIANRRKIIDLSKIERVYCTKLIGMYLDDKLNWVPHFNSSINKLGKLKGAFHYISQYEDKPYLKQIYYAYEFPNIRYGIE